LICDSKYYSFTSNICSGIINKNINDEEIKNILTEIKSKSYQIYNIEFNNLIFDGFLKEKIKLWKL